MNKNNNKDIENANTGYWICYNVYVEGNVQVRDHC